MAVLDGFRPFERMHDGILIRLRLEDWPSEVPVPKGSAIVGIGENHTELVYPYWRFVLESECTIDFLFGWFRIPLSFEETLAWHRIELKKTGYIEDPRDGFMNPPRAGMKFDHPQHKAQIRITVQRWETIGETTVMIRRILKHPYTPPEEEEAEARVEMPVEVEA